MRIIVLGGGLQGSACIHDLLGQEDVEAVTLADLEPERTQPFLLDDPRLERRRVDFSDPAAVARALEGHTVALSAAPYRFNAELARLALEAGCHWADLGGNTAILRRQIELDGAARRANVTLVPDVGLAPGMANVLAAEGIRRLDPARVVRMYVGGLPQRPKPPLHYQVVYSLEGTLDYYTSPCRVLRDGRVHELEALSELEELPVEDVGRLEAFHTAGGTSWLPFEFQGTVERLEYKTLRYPGHAVVMRAVRGLGLLDRTPVRVGEAEVVPRKVFIACATPRLRSDDPDMVVLRVLAEGARDGRPVRLSWDLVDRADEESGISAMERCTGFSLSITGLFLARGRIAERGAHPAYRATPYGAYLEELAARGIHIRFRELAAEGASAGEEAPAGA